MDTSKQLWRRAGQKSAKTIISIVLTALLTTTLAVPAFMHAGAIGNGQNSWISDIRGLVRDPLAYFSQRSPGMRGSRDLVQLKHRMFKAARNGVKPHEQVLSNVRYAPPILPYIDDLVPPVPVGPFSSPLSVPVGPAPSVPSITPPPVVPVTPAPPGTTPNGPPGTTAVPEPATWLTLILGMTLAGVGLRSKRRRQAEGAARIGFRVRT